MGGGEHRGGSIVNSASRGRLSERRPQISCDITQGTLYVCTVTFVPYQTTHLVCDVRTLFNDINMSYYIHVRTLTDDTNTPGDLRTYFV